MPFLSSFTSVLVLCLALSFGLAHEMASPSTESQKAIEPSERWAVELTEDVDPDVFAESHGFKHISEHPIHKNVHIFEKMGSKTNLFQRSDNILWSEKQEPRIQYKREVIPVDPLFAFQWHLHNTPGKDVNILPAWSAGYTGKNVTIAIVDDGLQTSHPDFSGNFASEASWDFNFNDPDPEPYSSDAHGTEAAGVAAAGINSICGVGTAPHARLGGLRLIAEAVDDFTESVALGFKSDLIDVYSCSWGPYDDGRRLSAPGILTSLTIERSIQVGRRGKGSIYVWAAGNGRRSGDNCNYDGYANSRYTISIGSIDFSGVQAWYSEDCAMLLAVTPSSGGAWNIYTTDLKSRAGQSTTDCSSSFGGTSASSPMAAGIVALVLQFRPELTWRDVQGILITSAVRVDTSDSDWAKNGAHLPINHKYGFGKLDAERVLETADDWKLLPEYTNASCGNSTVYRINGDWIYVSCKISFPDLIVEHVELQTDISCTSRGKLSISLESPSGTNSVLSNTRNDVSRDVPFSWKWGTLRTWGEEASGTWTVKLKSLGDDRLNRIQLTVYGHSAEKEV